MDIWERIILYVTPVVVCLLAAGSFFSSLKDAQRPDVPPEPTVCPEKNYLIKLVEIQMDRIQKLNDETRRLALENSELIKAIQRPEPPPTITEVMRGLVEPPPPDPIMETIWKEKLSDIQSKLDAAQQEVQEFKEKYLEALTANKGLRKQLEHLFIPGKEEPKPKEDNSGVEGDLLPSPKAHKPHRRPPLFKGGG